MEQEQLYNSKLLEEQKKKKTKSKGEKSLVSKVGSESTVSSKITSQSDEIQSTKDSKSTQVKTPNSSSGGCDESKSKDMNTNGIMPDLEIDAEHFLRYSAWFLRQKAHSIRSSEI